DGLRVGATALRTSVDFHLTLSPANIAALIGAGLVANDYAGAFEVSQRPDTWVIGSLEYAHEAWLIAAEYSRELKRQRSSIPAALPTTNDDNERFYVMAAYRPAAWLQLGSSYSVLELDDHGGHDPAFARPFYAFQRDLAATVRFDVNDHWL